MQALTEGLIALLSLLAILQWRRRGGTAARWVALSLGALALFVVAGRFLPEAPTDSVTPWLRRGATALLVAFPYLLFRFATSFRPASRLVRLAAGVACGAVLAPIVALPVSADVPEPAWVQTYLLVALTYWTLLSLVVAVQLWRGGARHAGVARWRMRLLSIGSLLLNAALLVSVTTSDAGSPGVEAGTQLAVLASTLLFFGGFVPPRALRTLSRRTAFEALQRGAGQLVAATHPDEVLAYLLPHATALVGGSGAAVVDGQGQIISAHGSVPEGEPGPAEASSRIELQLSSGTLLVWSSPYTPFFGGEETEIVGFLGALADLALERTRVSRREAWLADVVNSSDDAIVGMNLEGAIISWNGGAERLFGYTVEEVLGRDGSVLVPQGQPNRLPDIVERLRAGHPAENYETGRVCKDGEVLHVSLTVSATRDATGEITGISTIARDISQRRRLEAELAAAHDQALEAVRLKSEFLAVMSHEIRTPMNGVIGMTSLLLQTPLTPEQQEYTETIRRSGEALLTVINDILDFSKIEAGKLTFEVVDFDLRTAVEEVADLLAEGADAKGIELAVLVEADVPRVVRGDGGRLRQVLVNLASNAIKFTEQGEVIVRVGVAERSDDRVLLRFEVADTGIGIVADAQAGMFDSFTQADGSTTRRYGGTGLGLAISKRLVAMMGGEIGVNSELGNGSTFWFTAELDSAPDNHAAAVLDTAGLRGLPVLVVDDNETNRRILTLTLSSWGMRPLDAPHAAPALVMLREAARAGRPFALAVLDFLMPDMDGVDLARAVSADPLTRDVRLVLLSSASTRPDAETLREAGIAAALTKPVRQSALHQSLATVLGGPPAGRAQRLRASPAGVAALHPGHLLLVEDNAVNQKVAARMLETMGHRVDVAANGIEAVDAVRRIPYQAVLMDCQMPEMDGYEATRRIRRLEGRDTIPVIAMTAGVMASDQERCRAAGMDDFLPKPVRIGELRDMLDNWLAPERGAPLDRPREASDFGEHLAVDPEGLAGLWQLQQDSGKDLVGPLVTMYLDGADQLVGELRAALVAGDQPSVADAAHALRGSSATLGANGMAGLAARIERLVGVGDLGAAGATAAALDGELSRVREALGGQVSLQDEGSAES